LLQKKDDFINLGIKQLCTVKFGIRSQCLLLEKALNKSKQDQYFALKVNIKLGGINHKLAGDALGWLTQEPTILVDTDVTHPGLSSVPGMPSIAGVVASIDKDFVQFTASLRLQNSKQEVSPCFVFARYTSNRASQSSPIWSSSDYRPSAAAETYCQNA